MSVLADLRYATRIFRRRPAIAAVAAGSLAIGIGVGTGLFSVADALFIRPLAVAEPGRLVDVFTLSPSGFTEPLSWPEVRDLAAQAPSLASVAAFDRRGITLRRGDELESLLLTAVSDSYFDTLGVRPALGRLIGPGIDRGLPAPAVVVSDRLWRSRFGAEPSQDGLDSGAATRIAGSRTSRSSRRAPGVGPGRGPGRRPLDGVRRHG